MGPYGKLPKLVVHSLSPRIHNTTDRLHRHTNSKLHSKVFELKIMWGKDHPYQKAALNLHFLFHISQTRMKWEMKEVSKIWFRWWQYKIQKALLFSFEAAVPDFNFSFSRRSVFTVCCEVSSSVFRLVISTVSARKSSQEDPVRGKKVKPV